MDAGPYFRGIIVCWLLVGAGVEAPGQQYPFLNIAGSPPDVAAMFQDSRGRLWLGGAEATCFDGSHFFPLRDYGLPPGPTYDITEDPSGVIWLAAETGVYRFVGGRAELAAKVKTQSLIAIAPGLAAAAAYGAAKDAGFSLVRIRRDGNEWKTDTVMPLGEGGSLRRGASGSILFPLPERGWVEIRPDELAGWRPGDQVPGIQHRDRPVNPVTSVTRDRYGCLWFGTRLADAYDCGDGMHPAPYKWALVNANLREASDASMVLAGYSLLANGRPGAFQVATTANGLPGVSVALRARDGTLWVGNGGGILRFAAPFRIEYWTPREGISDFPWSIVRSAGKITAGLSRRIVALTKDRLRWETHAVVEEGGAVTSQLALPDNTLLACFVQGGAAQFAADGRVVAHTLPGQPKSGCMRLARTSDGEIWMTTHQLGRLKRQGQVLKWFEQPLRKPLTKRVLAVNYQPSTQTLWTCYEGGLAMRDRNHNWTEFTTADGLLTNDCWSLAALPNGDVWDAYFSAPAFALIRPRTDGGLNIRQYGLNHEVPGPSSTDFAPDRRGWLWRGGTGAVYVADLAEAEAGQWLQLDEVDGFPVSGANTGSIFVDNDGSLWWGGGNSVSHYTPPPDLVRPQFAPQVFISAFSWDNRPPRLAEAVTDLPHGSKITAHIGSLQFDRRNALRLRYRFLPGQPAWRETPSLDLQLGSLPTGSHTLEVQGRIFTGPWSSTVSRSFRVLRPVFLQWPFLAAYLMSATVLVTAGYLLRRRWLAENADLLPDLTAWRMGALLPDVRESTGTVLDSRFEVGDLLARGGFANVFSGYDRRQRQRCAVKIFRGELKDKAWLQRRFEQEVAALQKIRHPNVVSIYAHGAAPSGAPYLVMEFVDGRNLREVLESGPLSGNRIARLLGQLSSALEAIHAQGICHRDLKPENIIIRNDGTPLEQSVLIDFSIAIVKDANETLHGLSRAAGSFDYMAPEQAVGYAEPSSDIYSFAKLVIEMLTGRQLRDLLPDAALDLPDRVRELLGGLDTHLSEDSIGMIAAALEFDPAKRPRAAESFAAPLVKDLESDIRSERG